MNDLVALRRARTLMTGLRQTEGYAEYRQRLEGMIADALQRIVQCAPGAHDDKTHWLAVYKSLCDARDIPENTIRAATDAEARAGRLTPVAPQIPNPYRRPVEHPSGV